MRFTRIPTAEELPGTEPEAPAESGGGLDELREKVVEVLETVYDPEIPVNIYELGLIYEINIGDNKFVDIKMTLTSPACPVAGSLPPEVEYKVGMVPGVAGAAVELVWEPPWDMSKMSDAAKLQLNLM
jgi:FeS assembly SUF system protein